MGKIDYRAIEDLQGQVSSHYNSISEATATISSIDAKLAKLRSAKQSVGNIRSEIHEVKISVMVKMTNQNGKASKRKILGVNGRGSGKTLTLANES